MKPKRYQNIFAGITLCVAGGSASVALAQGLPPVYVGNTAGSVYFFDATLRGTSHFAIGNAAANNIANDIATDGSLLYVAEPDRGEIDVFTYSGTPVSTIVDPALSKAQGLAFYNGKLAVASGNSIDFFDVASKTYDPSQSFTIPDLGSADGIAVDGGNLYAIKYTANLVGNSLVKSASIIEFDSSGAVIKTLTDPAGTPPSGQPFGGTGLTSPAPGLLLVVGNDPSAGKNNWFEISDLADAPPIAQGQVLESEDPLDTNTLGLLGIAVVTPEPASLTIAAGALLLLTRRRR